MKFDGDGKVVLDQNVHAIFGPPALDVEVAGINRSYSGYLQELDQKDKDIKTVNKTTEELQAKIKKVTEQLSGELDENAQPARDQLGSVKEPGWYYLLENEVRTQNELKKEKTHLEPLWAKELADSAGVTTRRDRLLQRLRELGDTGYLSQSQVQADALRGRK